MEANVSTSKQNSPSSIATKSKRISLLIGYFLIFLIIFLWCLSSFLTKALFSELEYKKSFFVTYLNTSTFSVYLLIDCLVKLYRKHFSKVKQEESLSINAEQVGTKANNTIWSILKEYKESLVYCLFWFLANFLYNFSLLKTSISNAAICSSTSGLFTFALSCLFKIEQYKNSKAVFTISCFVGVLLISLPETQSKNNSENIYGIIVALLSAFMYGVYSVYFKKYTIRKSNEGKKINMRIFFGLVGLYNLLMGMPVLFILHLLKIEEFELPQTNKKQIITMLAVNALFGSFLSDFIWLYAVMLTSALTVVLGITLTTPISMLFDSIFNNTSNSLIYYVGTGIIIVSVFLINFF